jgi:general secretion pathway protein J
MTGRRGFTLLEVMLALGILGIVAVATYGTFSRTLRSRTLAEERAEITRLGRSALARMADEITAAYYPEDATRRPPGLIFRGLPGGTESEPLDVLVFSTVSARPSGWAARDGDLRVVTYLFPQSITGDRGTAGDAEDFFAAFGPRFAPPPPARPERLLRREAVAAGGGEELVPGPAAVVLDNVASLELRFHDGVEWLDGWDSEDRVAHYRRLPRAVAIDLALYDNRGAVHRFATAVDLPLADPRPGPRRAPAAGAGAPTPAGGTQ